MTGSDGRWNYKLLWVFCCLLMRGRYAGCINLIYEKVVLCESLQSALNCSGTAGAEMVGGIVWQDCGWEYLMSSVCIAGHRDERKVIIILSTFQVSLSSLFYHRRDFAGMMVGVMSRMHWRFWVYLHHFFENEIYVFEFNRILLKLASFEIITTGFMGYNSMLERLLCL